MLNKREGRPGHVHSHQHDSEGITIISEITARAVSRSAGRTIC